MSARGLFSLGAPLALALSLAGCASVMTPPVPESPFPGAALGAWAASPDMCAYEQVVFAPDRVERRRFTAGLTAAPESCEIEKVWTALFDTPVATYELSCGGATADQARSALWSVAARGERVLSVDRRDGAGPTELIRCDAPSPRDWRRADR